MADPLRLVFLLGGHDLEMLAIRDLLVSAKTPFHDRSLRWGAKASSYRAELAAARADGRTPVLIELENDLGLAAVPAVALPKPLPPAVEAITVDHHGPAAGDRPTALEQVFALLGLPGSAWTRWHDLVAANDRGHIAALRLFGADDDEIRRVRRADLAAQGVTDPEWAAASESIRDRRQVGGLTIVDLPHDRAGLAADLLDPAFGGPGVPEDLLVVSPGEVNFYGSGPRVTALAGKFHGGWCGGELPARGFWGHTRSAVHPDAVIAWLSQG